MTTASAYSCPSCGGPLHLEPSSGRLVCDYCDSSYSVDEIESRVDESYTRKQAAKAAADSAWPRYPASLLISSMKGTNALVTVNGVAITADDFERYSRYTDRQFRFSKGIPFGQKNEEADKAWRSCGQKLLVYMVRREEARQALAKLDVKVDPAVLKRVKRDFLENINRPKMKFDSVVAKLGEYGPYLEKLVEEDALLETALRNFSTNSLDTVSDEELAARKAEVVRIVADLSAKNSNTVERAMAARAEVLEGGRMFADVAKERADMAQEQGRFWDVLELAELSATSELAKWLASADTGDISGPLEMEDGLAIVGVMMKSQGPSSEIEGQDVDQYELARMLFKWYDPPEILDDDDEIREIMLEARRQDARVTFFDSLRKEDKIVFPSGDGIFRDKPRGGKHKPKPKQKAKGAKKKGKNK